MTGSAIHEDVPRSAWRSPSFAEGLPLTQEALAFATERHRGQRRGGDRAAFLLHPLEVAWLLNSIGQPDDVVAAGVLHDVVEDTDTQPDELRARFGDTIADKVALLTEDETIGDAPLRKLGLRRRIETAGADVAAIFAADKVSKVRELRFKRACRAGSAEEDFKLDHYRESLRVVERVLSPDHPLVAELRFELEALDLLPPAS